MSDSKKEKKDKKTAFLLSMPCHKTHIVCHITPVLIKERKKNIFCFFMYSDGTTFVPELLDIYNCEPFPATARPTPRRATTLRTGSVRQSHEKARSARSRFSNAHSLC